MRSPKAPLCKGGCRRSRLRGCRPQRANTVRPYCVRTPVGRGLAPGEWLPLTRELSADRLTEGESKNEGPSREIVGANCVRPKEIGLCRAVNPSASLTLGTSRCGSVTLGL